MQTIDINNETVLYFICHAFARWEALTGKKWNYTEELKPQSEYKVEFKINGVEMPFTEFLTDFYDQMDKMIAKKAKEVVNEELGDLFDDLSDFQKDIRRRMYEKFGYDEEYDRD